MKTYLKSLAIVGLLGLSFQTYAVGELHDQAMQIIYHEGQNQIYCVNYSSEYKGVRFQIVLGEATDVSIYKKSYPFTYNLQKGVLEHHGNNESGSGIAVATIHPRRAGSAVNYDLKFDNGFAAIVSEDLITQLGFISYTFKGHIKENLTPNTLSCSFFPEN